MKLLLLNTLYHPNVQGGAEKIVRIISEGLLGAGHEIAVVSLRPESGVVKAQVDGVRVYYVGLKNVYWPYTPKKRNRLLKPLWHLANSYNLLMAGDLDNILAAEKPDVVNTHMLSGFSCAAWSTIKRRHIPIVHTLHDHGLMCIRHVMSRRSGNCDGQCAACSACAAPAKHSSGLVDKVVGVSRYLLQRHLEAGYFANATSHTVIYNGLPGRARQAASQKDANVLCIGFVGRLVPEKGIEMLLSAVSALPQNGCRLVIAGAGDPDYERQLRNRFPMTNIEFLGHVDAEIAYKQIDLLVVPSLCNDSLPTVVMEAYRNGIPVIASDRGGLPEMVDHGRTGYVFPYRETESLQAYLAAVLQRPALLRKLGDAAREKYGMYRDTRMVGEYESLLMQSIG